MPLGDLDSVNWRRLRERRIFVVSAMPRRMQRAFDTSETVANGFEAKASSQQGAASGESGSRFSGTAQD
jgi:hypothetical protein